MSHHNQRRHRTRLKMKKHHWVLTFIAAVVVILYALDWVGGDLTWIWSRHVQRHRWVDATPSGPFGHR
jgi:hypothetical protein